MNKNFISLCAGILLGVSPLFAVPAKPVLVRVAQPDGTVVTVKTVGDEFYHYKSTSDGIPVVRGEDGFYRYAELSATGLVVAGNVIARDSSMRSVSDKAYLTSLSEKKISQKLFSRRNLRKQQLQNNITRRVTQATAGDDVHGLVLLVQFSDKKFSSVGTQQAFDEMMNKEGYDYMEYLLHGRLHPGSGICRDIQNCMVKFLLTPEVIEEGLSHHETEQTQTFLPKQA